MLDRDLVAAALPAYEIGDELGRGAWGIVLDARHLNLNRPVAVKQLPRAFGADPHVRSRFLSEARMLASLDHPHIVPVYDFVEYEGLCLLVMEKLPGGSVWSRFVASGLTMENACAVVLAACTALHYAHERGILHRDVKPENLLLSDTGMVKVSDFGIATVVGGARTVATKAGEVLGTPGYMAPEQAQAKPLSPATDVYALGTVLYELISTTLPFAEDSDPLVVLYRHVHEDPIPLIEAAPTVPEGIAAVVMRAMAREPSDRYPSAEAYGVALAEAAVEAWGPDWLRTCQFRVAPGPVLSAALGESGRARSGPSVTAFGQNPVETPFDVGAAAVPPHRPGPVVVPRAATMNNPRPVQVTDRPADLVTVDAAMTARGTDEATAGAWPPPASRRPPGRSRRTAFVAATALVAALVVVAAVVVLPGDDATPTASLPTTPTTQAPVPPVLGTPGDWRTIQAVPTARQQVGTAVADGTIWLVGGLQGDHATPKVEGYDPAIDTWKTGPDLPIPLHHAMAVAYKGELVVLGGWIPAGGNLTALASARVFALREGAWVEMPSLKRPRAAGAAAVAGDRIVVMGGQAASTLVTVTEVFDGTAWADAADIPTPREHLAGASDGRFVYAVGGRQRSSDKNVDSLERFDPTTGSWEALPPMPTARGGAGAAIVDGRLVVAGGESPTAVFGTVEAFDLTTSTWSAVKPLATPRHGMGVAAVGSSLYAIAGSLRPTHAEASDVAEVLDFL